MEIEVLVTLLGVALATLVAACGAGFRWQRSGLKRLETRMERLEDGFDRLEATMNNLIMALARSGVLIAPQTAEPGAAPPTAGSPSMAQPPARSPPPEPSGPVVQPA